MRELFRGADKNMYVDKNRAKMEEAAAEKSLQYRMLDAIKQQGFEFEDCLYCDAMLDQYRVLRAGPDLFLAQDGSYSGAVEQIAQELGDANDHKTLWAPLQLPELIKQLNSENTKPGNGHAAARRLREFNMAALQRCMWIRPPTGYCTTLLWGLSSSGKAAMHSSMKSSS